jgi:acyl-CoA hydrolase
MRDVAYTNSVHIIQQQHRMTAINSAIEVDFTGQVVSDSIGKRVFSGVGGQVSLALTLYY